MTWIQAPERWQRIAPVKDNTPPEFTEPIEFNKSGTANVSEEIATYLTNEYDDINKTDNE